MKSRTTKTRNIRREEALTAVADLTPKSVQTKIGELQTTMSNELGKVSGEFSELFRTLSTVEQAISYKQDELKRLHNLENISIAGDTLQDQIDTTRKEWNDQIEARTRQWEEEEKEYLKSTQRRQEEFDYEFNQKAKQRHDALDAEIASKAKQFKDNVEAKNKELSERHAAITAAEKELVELRTKAAGMQAEIDKAKEAEGKRVGAIIKKEYDYETNKRQTEFDAKVQLAEQKVQAAQAENARLEAQLSEANKLIDSLRRDLKEVSLSSFNSVSGRAALEAVKEVSSQRESNTKSGR